MLGHQKNMTRAKQVICAACGFLSLAAAGILAWVLIRILDLGFRVEWWSAEGFPTHEIAKKAGVDIMHLSTLGLILLGVLALGMVTVLTLSTAKDNRKTKQPQQPPA
jgi:hypothetical protein